MVGETNREVSKGLFTLSDESVTFLYTCIFGTEESGRCRGVRGHHRERGEYSLTPVISLGGGGGGRGATFWSLKMHI